MGLNVVQKKRLKEVLLAAFNSNYDQLRVMIGEGQWPEGKEWRLEQIATNSANINVVAFDLVGWSDQYGLVEWLLRNAREANPSSQELAKLQNELFPPGPPPAQQEAAAPPAASFRSTSVLDWLALEQARRAVCLVETALSEARATGVLVGPGMVATTYYGIGDFLPAGPAAQPGAPPPIKARFDYLKGGEGPARRSGKLWDLADDWLAAADRDLDFAFLRLRGEPGKEEMPGPLAGPRGWAGLKDVDVREDAAVFLIHHPMGRPVALSVGAVLCPDVGGGRLSHSAAIRPGSAGAPCFDGQLRLVALQQSKHPDGNRALRMDAVWERLTGRGLSAVLGG